MESSMYEQSSVVPSDNVIDHLVVDALMDEANTQRNHDEITGRDLSMPRLLSSTA